MSESEKEVTPCRIDRHVRPFMGRRKRTGTGRGTADAAADGSCLCLKPRDASCSRREWLENHKEHLEARLAQINQELSAECSGAGGRPGTSFRRFLCQDR